MAIEYADGAESEVLKLLQSTGDLSSTSLISFERYHEWPIRYHLSPERSNLLRHLDFTGLDVLELGAGMGAASRFIAETAKSFTAVEGAEDRLIALQERLRDLDNWEAVLANAQDYHPDKKFDVVCLIGVLEYSELYIDPGQEDTATQWLLKHAKSMLREGGQLIVAIENRNGLKYWSGAPEDHSGRMYHGICGYGPDKTIRTFSRKVLREHMVEAGLSDIEEFHPWPDYKTPNSVVHQSLVERHPFLAADIAADATAHEGLARGVFFPLTLALREVARSGLSAELANSFLFVCGDNPLSPTKKNLMKRTLANNERAWHYSIARKIPIETAFVIDKPADAKPIVRKSPFAGSMPDTLPANIQWTRLDDYPALLEETVSMSFRRMAFLNQKDRFMSELVRFIVWVFDTQALDSTNLRPEAFDLTPTNAVHDGRSYRSFDLEWSCASGFTKSWFILRCLLVLRDALQLFSHPPYAKVGDLYMHLCNATGIEPYLDGDILLEANAQADIQRNMTVETAKGGLDLLFHEPWKPSPFPRDPAEEERITPVDHRPSTFKRLLRVMASPRALAKALARRCRQLLSTI